MNKSSMSKNNVGNNSKTINNVNMNAISVIDCRGVSKEFVDADRTLKILSKVDFTLRKGEQIAIMGRSGSGKSTLLQILGGLDRPSRGTVLVKGQDIHAMGENDRAGFRNQSIGFVFQFHHLLPEFSAIENVAMPLLIAGIKPNEAKKRSIQLLEAVGLEDRLEHFPQALSGGERQRVAIARAMVMNPDCILADEPTGNLDDENANQVFDVMCTLNQTYKTSFIIVTHDESLAAKMDKTYILQGGQLQELKQSEQSEGISVASVS